MLSKRPDRWIAIVTVAALGAGCGATRGRRIGYGITTLAIGTAAFAVGTTGEYETTSSCGANCTWHTDHAPRAGLLVPGLVLACIGAINLMTAGRVPSAGGPPPREMIREAMTNRAHDAAVARDCITARQIVGQIRALDAAYYEIVVHTDRPIAACIGGQSGDP